MAKKLNKVKTTNNLHTKSIPTVASKLPLSRSHKTLLKIQHQQPTIKIETLQRQIQQPKKTKKDGQTNKEIYQHLFDPQIGNPITQAEFDMLTHYSSKTKSFGVSLLDEDGKFIFANKPANQLLQGCLNNFLKNSFTKLIIESQRNQIASQLKGNFEQKIIKYCIYSKNMKRKLLNTISNPKVEYSDFLYFKYVKCLISRIRPVAITFKSYSDIDGFWNHQIANKLFDGNQSKILFLMETKINTNFQNIQSLNLVEDPVIKKFEHSEQTKQVRRLLKDMNITVLQKIQQKEQKQSIQDKQEELINSGKRTLGKYSSTRSLRI